MGTKRLKPGERLHKLGKQASWNHDDETQIVPPPVSRPKKKKKFSVEPAPDSDGPEEAAWLVGEESRRSIGFPDFDPDATTNTEDEKSMIKTVDKGKGKAVIPDESDTESEKVRHLNLSV